MHKNHKPWKIRLLLVLMLGIGAADLPGHVCPNCPKWTPRPVAPLAVTHDELLAELLAAPAAEMHVARAVKGMTSEDERLQDLAAKALAEAWHSVADPSSRAAILAALGRPDFRHGELLRPTDPEGRRLVLQELVQPSSPETLVVAVSLAPLQKLAPEELRPLFSRVLELDRELGMNLLRGLAKAGGPDGFDLLASFLDDLSRAG